MRQDYGKIIIKRQNLKTELENPAQETLAQKREDPGKNRFSTRSLWLIFAAIFSAIAATFCCLPALLFLIFGASFSLLSSEAIESLTELRPYFTALAAICFAASAFYFFKKPKSCDIANRRKKWIFIYVFLAVFVIILLSYPEVLGKIYE